MAVRSLIVIGLLAIPAHRYHAAVQPSTEPSTAEQMGSLDGLRVVDLSWGWAGPMATGQLADHGSSVVRVEPPGGDPYRPFVSHAAFHRGQRSLVADLGTPE